jgi:hypothetical protein
MRCLHCVALGTIVVVAGIVSCGNSEVTTIDPNGAGTGEGAGAGSGGADKADSPSNGGTGNQPGPGLGLPMGDTSTTPPDPSAATKNCGLRTFDLDKAPGELLLVLDKSSSMSGRLPNSQIQKFTDVTMALDQIVARTQGSVLWGLKLFPSEGSCGVADGANVPPAMNNHKAIVELMQRIQPNGRTPVQLAMQKATAYLKTRTSANPRYVLLATDGMPNCDGGANGAIAAVEAAAKAGYPTFVVGIATAGTTAHATLNQMAMRGERPRMDPMTQYFPVESREEMVAALANIAGQVTSCTFRMGEAPPSPNDVAVNVDGMRVPRDMTRMEGWEYAGPGMRNIILYGSWCEKVKSEMVKNVQIIFGCPGVVIP